MKTITITFNPPKKEWIKKFLITNNKNTRNKFNNSFLHGIISGQRLITPEKKRKNIVKELSSKKFQQYFYGTLNIKPYERFSFIKNIVRFFITKYNAVREKFREKNHIEKIIDRLDTLDQLSIQEKRDKMKKYGVLYDVSLERFRDDDDPITKLSDAKLEIEGIKGYEEEISNFVENDENVKKIQEEDSAKYTQLISTLSSIANKPFKFNDGTSSINIDDDVQL